MLKEVENDHGVVFIRDRRKSQLRIFGSEISCRHATEALGRLIVQGGVSNGRIIELDSDEFQWACRGGFKALASQLGDDKAAFDIVSTPKRILIDGSDADCAAARAVIANRQDSSVTTPSDTQTECSVCWTEAEEPIHTPCNHIYCTGCFVDMCQAKASTSPECRITCVGEEDRCEKVLALPELQELLSSAAFEGVLEASFSSYVRQHPADFRYCPTPDCGLIYRVGVEGAGATTAFTCSKCLIPTCTVCHNSHGGMTCAENRDLASGGYQLLEIAKKKLGIKDCPQCKTAIEKIDGCNHMTCGGCGTHICWVCLSTFKTSEQCYGHLNKMHGGVFDFTR